MVSYSVNDKVSDRVNEYVRTRDLVGYSLEEGMARRRTRRRAPPSRLRYEEEHPTVSFRVPRVLYDDLKEMLGINEQSFADFVKEALGAKAPNVEGAYTNGYSAAKEAFLVTYRCRVCRKIVEVESSEAKAAARQFLEEIDGLAHEDC